MDVGPPQPVALLQPQRVERSAAGSDEAVRLPRRPQHVPQAQGVLGRAVKLPAQFAGVGDAQGQGGYGVDSQRPGGEVGEGSVGYVLLGYGGQDVACLRPPQADARPLCCLLYTSRCV